MAQAKRQAQQKVLRIALALDGKIVQERLIKANEPVTVGESTRNTFVFPPTSLPKRFQLFQPTKGGGYIMHFTDAMHGKVSYKNAVVPLEKLREKGDAVNKGGDYSLSLDTGNRGKVSIDGVTILFQFVPPPPEPAVVMSKMDFRPKLIDADDPVFYGFLGLFSALAAVFMIWVYQQEPVDHMAMDQIPDRFTSIVMEKSEPKEVVEAEIEVDDSLEGPAVEKAEKSEAVKPSEKSESQGSPDEPLTPEQAAAAAAAQRAANEAQVESNPLLMAILGTTGVSSSGDRVQDLFGDSDFAGQDLDSALASVTGAEMATSAGLEARTGTGGNGRADADIGDLKGASTGEVGVGSGPKTAVTGAISLGGADATMEQGDAGSVSKVVRRFSGQVKYCYEAQLKTNPSLSGRVEVAWTVRDGRVSDATLFSNTTGNDTLGKCIVSKVKRWRFPDGVEGDVVYPFILTPSN